MIKNTLCYNLNNYKPSTHINLSISIFIFFQILLKKKKKITIFWGLFYLYNTLSEQLLFIIIEINK